MTPLIVVILLAVFRLTWIAAIWLAWGWIAGVLTILVLIVSNQKVTGILLNTKNQRLILRIAIELLVLVVGVLAVASMWGWVWGLALFIAYVIIFVWGITH
jgi:hypothetical protein